MEDKAIYKDLDVDVIKLDLDNPRIKRALEMYRNNVTTEQMSLALGAGSPDNQNGPSFNDLKNSIFTNDGIIHPIIVNEIGKNNFVVIEGNTRTIIYREFKEKYKDKKWNKIPAMIYSNLDNKIIDGIRLQAHLVGPREWDPYSKAKYLQSLRYSKHLTFDQIVDFCGGSKSDVEKYIIAYEDMEKYYKPLISGDQDFDHTRFSSFVELQSPRVIDAIIENNYTKKDFARWVIDYKLIPIANVRQLPRILKNKKAKEIFLKNDSKAALDILAAENVSGNSDIESIIKDASIEMLCKGICSCINQNMKYSDIQKLKDESFCDVRDLIIEAKDAISNLVEDIS